jgi:hypothetical protein
MKKTGPLNEALADIFELDKQARDLVRGPVVYLDKVRSEYGYLRRMRRDKVRQIETSTT